MSNEATAKWRLESNGDIVDASGTVLLKVWNGYDHGVEAVNAINERDALLAEVGRLREALDEAWTNAIETVNKTDMRLQYLSESGEEIVRHDRARVVQALEAARAALSGKKEGEGNG